MIDGPTAAPDRQAPPTLMLRFAAVFFGLPQNDISSAREFTVKCLEVRARHLPFGNRLLSHSYMTAGMFFFLEGGLGAHLSVRVMRVLVCEQRSAVTVCIDLSVPAPAERIGACTVCLACGAWECMTIGPVVHCSCAL